jgi:hypothetical protein
LHAITAPLYFKRSNREQNRDEVSGNLPLNLSASPIKVSKLHTICSGNPDEIPEFSKFTLERKDFGRLLEGIRDMAHCRPNFEVASMLIDLGAGDFNMEILWCRSSGS